jgi:hypothetical protein
MADRFELAAVALSRDCTGPYSCVPTAKVAAALRRTRADVWDKIDRALAHRYADRDVVRKLREVEDGS